MSPGVSQICNFPLASTTNIEDTSTKEGEIWATTEETLRTTTGVQDIFWSRWIENKDMVQMIVNWDSIEDHQRFRETPSFPAFEKSLVSITNDSPSTYHAHLTPHPPTHTFEAPVVEALTCYFPSKFSPEERDSWYQRFRKYLEKAIVDAEGLVAEAHGWVVEEITYNSMKSNAFVCFIGWDSVEKHVAYRETNSFKDNIYLVHDGTRGMEAHHIKFSE